MQIFRVRDLMYAYYTCRRSFTSYAGTILHTKGIHNVNQCCASSRTVTDSWEMYPLLPVRSVDHVIKFIDLLTYSSKTSVQGGVGQLGDG